MNRLKFFFTELVTETDLNAAFDNAEAADRVAQVDLANTGVKSGLVVSPHSPVANLTVDVTAGIGIDKDGKRLSVGSLQTVDLSVDESNVSTTVTGSGKSKIISLFLAFNQIQSVPITDGLGNAGYFNVAESFKFVVRQGAEAASPSAPALDASMILLADITRSFGVTTITAPNISTSRREDWFINTAFGLRGGTVSAVLTALLTALGTGADALLGAVAYAGASGIFSLSNGSLQAQLRAIADQLDHGKRRSISRAVAGAGTTTIDNGQNDVHIYVNTSSGARTLNLPAPAALAGREIHVWDVGNSFGTNNCTLHRAAAEKINFVAADLALSTNGQHVIITTNGTDWFVQ